MKQVEDLGWRYLDQHLDLELSPALKAAIDPIPFGRQAMEEDRGLFYEVWVSVPLRGRVAA